MGNIPLMRPRDFITAHNQTLQKRVGARRADAQKGDCRDLYALLVHTTSTHATQEFGAYPWSTRDYMPQNILPDGSRPVWWKLNRNMLVREYQSECIPFSAVSPEWLRSVNLSKS